MRSAAHSYTHTPFNGLFILGRIPGEFQANLGQHVSPPASSSKHDGPISSYHSFFLSYACSILYAKHLFPTPIPLLYNPFTIVSHKRLSAYPFQAAHTPVLPVE